VSCDLIFQEVIAITLASAMPTVSLGAQPPPEDNDTLPYVQFGQSEVRDEFAPGHEILTEVHVWSAVAGPHEAKTLQGQIRDALHSLDFTRSGWKFTNVREENARTFLDVDGETWHGVQRFRALAGPA
jgi:hypothetical protein